MNKETAKPAIHTLRNAILGISLGGLGIAGFVLLDKGCLNQAYQEPRAETHSKLPVFAASARNPNTVNDSNPLPTADPVVETEDSGDSPFASFETNKTTANKPTPTRNNSLPTPTPENLNPVVSSLPPQKTSGKPKIKEGWQEFSPYNFPQIRIDYPSMILYPTVPSTQTDFLDNKIVALIKSPKFAGDFSEIVVARNSTLLLTQVNEYTIKYLKKAKEIDPNAEIIEEITNTAGEHILIIHYTSDKDKQPWLKRETFIALPQGYNLGYSITLTTTSVSPERQEMFYEIVKSFKTTSWSPKSF